MFVLCIINFDIQLNQQLNNAAAGWKKIDQNGYKLGLKMMDGQGLKC